MTKKAQALKIILCVALASSSAAIGCYKPNRHKPLCVISYGGKGFDDELDYSVCRTQVEYYLKNLNDWADCLERKAEEAKKEKVRRSKDIMWSLECKRLGKKDCP